MTKKSAVSIPLESGRHTIMADASESGSSTADLQELAVAGSSRTISPLSNRIAPTRTGGVTIVTRGSPFTRILPADTSSLPIGAGPPGAPRNCHEGFTCNGRSATRSSGAGPRESFAMRR